MSYLLQTLNLLRKKNMRPNRVRSSVRAEHLLGADADGSI